MKVTILYFLILLNVPSILGQEKRKQNISRTIGISLPFMYVRSDDSYNHRKFGIQYRQCTPKYLLQIELNTIQQNQFEALGENRNQTSYIINENTRYYSKVDLNHNVNTQITLSKGWTNDLINIYVGSGIILGHNSLYFSSRLTNTYTEIDSVNLIYNTIIYESDFKNSSANYFYMGLVAKTSIEFQINAKFSAMIQFSTFFNYNWRYKTDFEFSKKQFTSLNSNGLELCFAYLL